MYGFSQSSGKNKEFILDFTFEMVIELYRADNFYKISRPLSDKCGLSKHFFAEMMHLFQIDAVCRSISSQK